MSQCPQCRILKASNNILLRELHEEQREVKRADSLLGQARRIIDRLTKRIARLERKDAKAKAQSKAPRK